MEDEYEVPSPHERELEEAVEKERDGLTQNIALMTAILATIGALISYQSGSAQNEAMFLKNQSILKQAEASDQWAFYQAKSMKGHLDDAVAALSSTQEIKARYLADKKKQDREKAEVQAEAQKLQAESRKLGEESEAKLKPHERLALALTFIQIAIALAAHYRTDQAAVAALGFCRLGSNRDSHGDDRLLLILRSGRHIIFLDESQGKAMTKVILESVLDLPILWLREAGSHANQRMPVLLRVRAL